MYTSQGLGASEKKKYTKKYYIIHIICITVKPVLCDFFQRNSEIWSHKTGGRLIQV
jgi:general stress protein CsbA